MPVVTGTSYERGSTILMARIVGRDRTPIVQATLNALSYEVWNILEVPTRKIVSETALTISGVIYNTLQTDERWTVDDEGYNFLYELPAVSLENRRTWTAATKDWFYRVEFKFDPLVGEDFWGIFEIQAKDVLFGD